MNARLAELRAEVRARWSDYRRGATLLVREASSGVTVDPRDVVTEQVGDLSLRFLAGDFFQNNPFLLPRLVAHVAQEATAGGARLLVDAYCGSGLLGLAAAPRFERVLGVEVSPSAVSWARENAARNGRTNCEFIAADASAVFAGIPFAGADAAVIVDPPRKGCGDVFLAQLCRLRAAHDRLRVVQPARRRRATSRRWPPLDTPACACSPSTCSRRRGTSRPSRR